MKFKKLFLIPLLAIFSCANGIDNKYIVPVAKGFAFLSAAAVSAGFLADDVVRYRSLQIPATNNPADQIANNAIGLIEQIKCCITGLYAPQVLFQNPILRVAAGKGSKFLSSMTWGILLGASAYGYMKNLITLIKVLDKN